MAKAEFDIEMPRGIATNFEDVTDRNVPSLDLKIGRMPAPPEIGSLVEVQVYQPRRESDLYGTRRTRVEAAQVVQVVHQPSYDDDDEPMMDVHVTFDFDFPSE